MGATHGRLSIGMTVSVLVAVSTSDTLAGLVNLELRPTTQTVTVGNPVEVGLYAVSADGTDQTVGFVGVVILWDPDALALTGHTDGAAFPWASSGFPSDPGGLNETFSDGDAYYQAIVLEGGDLGVATADGSVVTTLEFTALSAAIGPTAIGLASCVGGTCTLVLDRHPFDAGVTDVTGSLGAPAEVTILCETHAQCEDDNPCTDDSCELDSTCSHVPNDANDPDDGLFCNGHEICEGGQVVIEPDSTPDCDDELACTIDSCNETTDQCDHDLADGYCFIDSSCHADGSFNPANDCEICDSSTASGQWLPRTEGVACGDPTDAECNGADTCDGLGTCLDNLVSSGTACGDSSDTECTDPDTCDGAGMCEPHHASDGTTCDDGLFCTVTDACSAGICVGGGDRCPNQVCDESTDACKAVNLEFRPGLQGPIVVGEIAEIGLYAISDTATDQPISALNVIITWDSSRLALLGNVNNGPYSWLLSNFPDDSELDGLNDTHLDGNALYQALAMPAPTPPAVATTEGLLATTLQFQAVGDGTGEVRIAATFGELTETEVIDAETVGLAITGSLGAPAAVDIIACLDNEDCDDGEFCTGVETCVDMDCVAGIPPDCDDGLFCNGVETCEFGIGCVSPGNPCPDPVSCNETDDDCGGCGTPTVAAEGCRYLAVTPTSDDDPVAILVEAVSSDPKVSCVSVYVQADGTLDLAPVFLTPTEWDTVHVTGLEIVPSTTYTVQADCRPEGIGYLSAPAFATTWVWGDVNNDGMTQIDDVTLVHLGALGIFEGTTVENLDVAGCVPNRQVDAEDVAHVEAAYMGGAFDCPAPCAACLSIDPPQPEPADVPKNRYLSFLGGHAGQRVAVRVTFADLPAPFDALNSQTMWIGEPAESCENAGEIVPSGGECGPAPGLPSRVFWSATLRCEPYYTDWSALGTVHVYGKGIVSSGVYELQVIDEICDTTAESAYSAALPVVTSLWGDVVEDCTTNPCGPPDGYVNLTTDVTAVLDKFKNLVGAPIKARCDLGPNQPNLLIDISDVAFAVDAFRGFAYPFDGPDPNDLCP